MYNTTIELYYQGKLCDTYSLNLGIRTVKLYNEEILNENNTGEFCFEINSKKVFVLGTNWVPLDALHSNDANRLSKAIDLLEDIGCNAVRCWGGNVYESDEFFDLCDKKGIMVWQDFAMGCAVYPQDREFMNRLEEEAIYQVKRLRNHPALILWAGDNECDCAYGWSGYRRNPNNNMLTRKVLKDVVDIHDYARPYLPSSPFISEKSYQNKLTLTEDHLWGPRDYFKGEYYRNSICHFASETGYHGFPSVSSLKKFLKEPEKIFDENGIATDEYLVHAASPEITPDSPYAYRIRLAYTQVETLFGKAENNFDDFVKQSQISQAEAKKYFIEKFRIGKGYRTGIIWWNLIDGWPQVSDAVVDYYYSKKLAYHYIKRSQQPLCLMFDEPVDNVLRLVAVNDLQKEFTLSYSVVNLTDNIEVLNGTASVSPDCAVTVDHLKIPQDDKKFYLIKWYVDSKEYTNHYFTNILNINYHKYLSAIENCGYDEF